MSYFGGTRSSALQIQLREAVFHLLGDKPGLCHGEILAEMVKTIECNDAQVRCAVYWLRDRKYLANEGDYVTSRYVQIGDAVTRCSIPARNAPLPACRVMPTIPLLPAQWWLHMLSHPAPHESARGGQNHWKANLSDEQIVQMRAKYQHRVYGYGKLAKEFGCPESTVRDVVLSKTRANA